MAALFITPPERNHPRSANADWMELQALRAANRRSTVGDLIGLFDINDDAAGDPASDDPWVDESILDTGRDHLIDQLFDELQYRARVLGDAYPFTIERDPPALARAARVRSTPGRVVYLFCLLASAIRENRLQPAALTTHATARIATLFQVCASLAAAGYIVGDAVSFGFPRPSGSNFLSALRDTYRQFGSGEIRQTVLAGWPTSAKDDGVDVIAWRHHPDRMPGKLYLLGQCASGRNWRDKSVVDRIAQFHGWFSTPPATHYLPSMFIPFTLHGDLADDSTTTFDTLLANRHLRAEQRYGIVFDRFRIAHFADTCLGSVGGESTAVDDRDRFSDVETWVKNLLEIPEFMESA